MQSSHKIIQLKDSDMTKRKRKSCRKKPCPPDLFFPTQMTVNKGDRVLVHFYNLEPEETQEHHTFTMASGPYRMHHDLNAGEQKTIEFAASEAGVYDYVCVLHPPTMKGQLIVLG